jgi:ATP-dependent Clp protease ATP-binding subunit ClpA
VSHVFERFSDPAREAVVMAQVEARELRHGYIGTEHLLLGVLRQGVGPGARALARLGIDVESARSDVVRIIGLGHPTREGDEEALRAIGIDLDQVRRRVEEAFGPGALDRDRRGLRRRVGRRRVGGRRARWRRRCGPVGAGGEAHLPFTARAKKVLELSLREAVAMADRFIGSEHLVLALAREGRGLAAQILSARGASSSEIRAVVLEEIGRGRDSPGRSA